MRVRSEQKVPQYDEVRVEPFDTPLHWESVNGYHLTLLFDVPSKLRCDVLVHASNDAGGSRVSTEQSVFCHCSVSPPDYRGCSSALHCLVKQLGRRCIQSAVSCGLNFIFSGIEQTYIVELSLVDIIFELLDQCLELLSCEIVNIWLGIWKTGTMGYFAETYSWL